MAFIRST